MNIFVRSPKGVDFYAGSMLKKRRKELGLTQKDLANSVGITFQQIQKYEKGVNRMGVSRLCDFCRVLGVKPSYFFSEEDKIVPASNHSLKVAESEDNNTQMIELLDSFNKITDNAQKDLVIEFVKFYVEKIIMKKG